MTSSSLVKYTGIYKTFLSMNVYLTLPKAIITSKSGNNSI